MKTWLIAEPGKTARTMQAAVNPSTLPDLALDPAHVVDPAETPEDERWLRYCGTMSDATYDRLKAAGRVKTEGGRLIWIGKPKGKGKTK